jgi:two-component system, sensor histidine kinase and response regulator
LQKSHNIPHKLILEKIEGFSYLNKRLEKYGFDLIFYQERAALEAEQNRVIWNISLSLILGVLIIFMILLLLGKKILLDPAKRIEESEREQRLFRAIIENTNDAVLITEGTAFDGPDHPRIEYVNPAFTDLSGYAAEEAIGKTPRILQRDDIDPEVRSKINESLKAENYFQGELLNYSKEGKPYWVEISIFPIRDSDGKLLHFGAVERDITERKEFQRKIESTTQRLTMATESAGIGVWDWNLVGGQLLWNKEMWALYEQEPLETGDYDLWVRSLHPDDKLMATDAIEKAIKGDANFDIIFRIILPSGVLKHIKGLALVVRDGKGEPVQMVGVNQDVTAQVEFEEAMAIATQEAEEANRMKSEFLANMSHEIRTPLNGLIGASYLLKDLNLPPEENQLVDTINSSGESLLFLINDILDLSKIEAGKLEIEKHQLNLHKLIQDLETLFSIKANEKSLGLTFELEQGVPEIIMGDSGRIRQVLTNLIGNSLKFTSEGGVEVLVKRHSEGDQVELYFSIKDSGIGIPEEHQDSLFESFRQVDASITREFGGSGLGLAISRSLVQMMNGAIGFESQLGKGTTFWFKIPLDEDEIARILEENNMLDQELKTDHDEGNVKGSLSGKILICEDNRTNIEILMAMLNKLGDFEIEIANNGEEGVHFCQREKYDLVLMDVQMPILDGMKATEQIRQNESVDDRVTIVSLTANALSGDRESCLRAGMNDYLSKPIHPKALEDILRKWLSSSTMSSKSIETINVEENHPVTEPLNSVLSEDLPVLDEAGLLERLMEDRDLAVAVLTGFMEECGELISKVKAGLENDLVHDVKELSHTLKGSASNVAACRISELARRMEDHLKSGHPLGDCAQLVSQLEKELQPLEQEIVHFKNKSS